MTPEDKELLVKDLCARLPYGVKISIPDLWTQKREIEILDEIFKGDDGLYRVNSKGQCIEHIKPYLIPISNMNEVQKNIYSIYINELKQSNGIYFEKAFNSLQFWLYANHFDVNNLIPMGLAINAVGLNIY